MNITTATPAQIDEKLAEIYGRYYAAMDEVARIAGAITSAESNNAQAAAGRRYYSVTSASRLAELTARLAAAQVTADAVLAETAPFDAEFDRRGGWTRAYLVQNNGGHVHRSMGCATCFITTRFGWLTQVSGHSEDEIVSLAGEGACTVCYPSAPAVGVNRLELPAVKAARDERAAAKAARDAAKAAKAITAPDGSVLRIPAHGRTERIETLAAAWLELVSDEANAVAYGYSRNEAAQAVLVAAIAAKLGQTEEEVRKAQAVKVAARIKREAAGR